MQIPEEHSSDSRFGAQSSPARRYREAGLLLALAILYGVVDELVPPALARTLRWVAFVGILACVLVWLPRELARLRHARAARLQALKDELAARAPRPADGGA